MGFFGDSWIWDTSQTMPIPKSSNINKSKFLYFIQFGGDLMSMFSIFRFSGLLDVFEIAMEFPLIFSFQTCQNILW